MQIEERIAHRQDMVGDIGRDLLGDGAVGIAGKRAVEIEPVDRRSAARGDDRVHVVGGHQDEPALDRSRIEFAREFADDDRSLVLVAVVSPSMMTVGPTPLAMMAIGTRVTPHASSCGECGNITKPICRPFRSKSTAVKAVVGRAGWPLLIVVLSWSAAGTSRRGRPSCTGPAKFDNMQSENQENGDDL